WRTDDAVSEVHHGSQRRLIPRRVVEKPMIGPIRGEKLHWRAGRSHGIHVCNGFLIWNGSVRATVEDERRRRRTGEVHDWRCVLVYAGNLSRRTTEPTDQALVQASGGPLIPEVSHRVEEQDSLN